MQPKQNMPIPKKDDNVSTNFRLHEDEKSTMEKQEIEGDHTKLVGKNLEIRSRARDNLLGHTT